MSFTFICFRSLYIDGIKIGLSQCTVCSMLHITPSLSSVFVYGVILVIFRAHDGVNPVDVVANLGVNTRPIGSGTSVAIACYAVKVPVVVTFLTHEGPPRVSQTCVAAPTLVTGTEHVVSDTVQWQE